MYKKTRVILQTGVSAANPQCDYINACYANSPFEKVGAEGTNLNGDKKIICSQGPLPETTEHFW